MSLAQPLTEKLVSNGRPLLVNTTPISLEKIWVYLTTFCIVLVYVNNMCLFTGFSVRIRASGKVIGQK
jgi:hypothetical protein